MNLINTKIIRSVFKCLSLSFETYPRYYVEIEFVTHFFLLFLYFGSKEEELHVTTYEVHGTLDKQCYANPLHI